MEGLQTLLIKVIVYRARLAAVRELFKKTKHYYERRHATALIITLGFGAMWQHRRQTPKQKEL